MKRTREQKRIQALKKQLKIVKGYFSTDRYGVKWLDAAEDITKILQRTRYREDVKKYPWLKDFMA